MIHGHQMSEPETPSDAARLLALLEALASEVHRRPPASRATLDTDIERDLGLDSLARVELLARMERHFGVVIPEEGFIEARTPARLLELLAQSRDRGDSQPAAMTVPAPLPDAAAVTLPLDAHTLVEVLEWHAARVPERVHIRFYEDDGDGATITYRELLEGARTVAAQLHALDIGPGDTVALMLQTGEDYFHCFFGIMLAGAVPVPLYPPASAAQFEDHMQRQAGVLENCGARVLVTMQAAHSVARLLRARVDTLHHAVTPEMLRRRAAGPAPSPPIRATNLAFLQYTSGSTGAPKGVMLNHANLLANIRAMAAHIDAGPDDVFVSWLPLYHDMGLIGAWLGSLYCAAELVIMSPLAFIARPQRWLRAIHRHRATLSASPNFGYALCVDRLEDADLEGLDLGSWRCAFNGAEPVSPRTLNRFAERFAAFGLKAGALMPVYGLAECSVGLAFPPLGRGPRYDRVSREALLHSSRAQTASADDQDALEFVSCGHALPGHEIRVVDDAGEELPERMVGHLHFRGPSATSGYFRNEEATRKLIRGQWLDSGDLAYVAGGEIHVTGRVKDLIIRAGRNLYPQEIEEAVGRLPGVRAGRVVAFAARDAREDRERLVVIAETRDQDTDARARLQDRIAGEVAALGAGPPDDILLALPGTILKTPSGKVRRSAMRELYERDAIRTSPLPVWRQFSHLYLTSLPGRLRRWTRSCGRNIYAAWAHFLFWGIGAPLATLAILLPGRRRRWRALRVLIAALAAATGIRLRVENEHLLPAPGRGAVIVCNHASYLDAPLLILGLREPVSFVAKAELSINPLLRFFLGRLGTQFVDRFDARRGAADARRLTEVLGTGETLLYFPEGTFTPAPGLRAFRMGAFIAAAEARTALIPMALRGTRSLMRSGSWRPRPGRVTLSIAAPLPPVESNGNGRRRDNWNAAMELRDHARAEILARCGEQDSGK
jgi:1-acyl-sn-glycerol-3-phosphate acyltransferase